MVVRPVEQRDAQEWLAMRARLWPDSAPNAELEIQSFFDDGRIDGVPHAVFVAEHSASGRPIGFVEATMRDGLPDRMNGPAGYVEGWYVEPECRRCGAGRALLLAAEAWAMRQGAVFMASDTDIEHADLSLPAHAGCGYARVGAADLSSDNPVYFIKRLRRP